MNSSYNDRSAAYIRRRAMLLEAQGQRANPYHYRHIDQFCDYADCVAEAVKQEILKMLPQMIQEALKQPKVEVEVDEASLRQVRRKIESILSGIFGNR